MFLTKQLCFTSAYLTFLFTRTDSAFWGFGYNKEHYNYILQYFNPMFISMAELNDEPLKRKKNLQIWGWQTCKQQQQSILPSCDSCKHFCGQIPFHKACIYKVYLHCVLFCVQSLDQVVWRTYCKPRRCRGVFLQKMSGGYLISCLYRGRRWKAETVISSERFLQLSQPN